MDRCHVALVAAGEREHKGATVKVCNLVLAEQAELRAAGGGPDGKPGLEAIEERQSMRNQNKAGVSK